jgi:hypothetical protein
MGEGLEKEQSTIHQGKGVGPVKITFVTDRNVYNKPT